MDTCIVKEVTKFEEVENLFKKAHQENHNNSENYDIDQMRERWKNYLLFTVVTFKDQVIGFAGIYPFGKNLVRVADRLYIFPSARLTFLSAKGRVKSGRPAIDHIIPYQTKWAKKRGLDCFYSIQELKKRNSLIKTTELLDPTLGYSVLPGLYLNIFEDPDYAPNWQNIASTTKNVHLPKKNITST